MFTSRITNTPLYQPRHLSQSNVLCRRNVNRPHPTLLKATIADTAHVIGDGIGLFTLFYCSLNWVYYKNINNNNKEK